MADISAEIAAFKGAVYGEEVRNAMVSLAQKVNNEATDIEQFSTWIDRLRLTNENSYTPSYAEVNAPYFEPYGSQGSRGLYYKCGETSSIRGLSSGFTLDDSELTKVTSAKHVADCIQIPHNNVLYATRSDHKLHIDTYTNLTSLDNIYIIFMVCDGVIIGGNGAYLYYYNMHKITDVYMDVDDIIHFDSASNSNSIFMTVPVNYYIRGRRSITLRRENHFSDLTFVTSPNGFNNSIEIPNAQALIYRPLTNKVMLVQYDNISKNDILLFVNRSGYCIGGIMLSYFTKYINNINSSFNEFTVATNDTQMTGLYVESTWDRAWIKPLADIQLISPWFSPYLDFSNVAKETSPLGEENCILLRSGYYLVANAVTGVVEKNTSWDDRLEKLHSNNPYFHLVCLLQYRSGRFTTGVMKSMCEDTEMNHMLTLSADYRVGYLWAFEAVEKDLYIYVGDWYIRSGYAYFNKTIINNSLFKDFYESRGLEFVNSPGGLSNCIHLQHNQRLMYNCRLDKLRIYNNPTNQLAVGDIEMAWNVNGMVYRGAMKNVYDQYIRMTSNTETSIDIVSLNKDVNAKLSAANKRTNIGTNGQSSLPPILTLLHFSDIHGGTTQMRRIMEFYRHYENQIDDAICTGDIIQTRYINSMDFWNSAVNENYSPLTIVGNHDALFPETGYDWTQITPQADLYSKFIGPYKDTWGDSWTSAGDNLSYWYKDYDDHYIRLIGLNCCLKAPESTSEITWLTNLLNETPSDYSVIIAQHYPFDGTKIDCLFTSPVNTSSYIGSNTDIMVAISNTVQTFIDNGGNFICYLCGHTHEDFIQINTMGNSTNQLVVTANCAHYENVYGITPRVNNTKSMDLFNIVSFDTYEKYIKIFRVGAEYDSYLRHKGSLILDYSANPVSVVYED